MCPFGDIKDVPDSSYGKSGFFIVGSSCADCPLSKTVLQLSVAWSSAELQSVTHNLPNHPTNQPTPCKDRATQALLSWKLSSSWAILGHISSQTYLDTYCNITSISHPVPVILDMEAESLDQLNKFTQLSSMELKSSFYSKLCSNSITICKNQTHPPSHPSVWMKVIIQNRLASSIQILLVLKERLNLSVLSVFIFRQEIQMMRMP